MPSCFFICWLTDVDCCLSLFLFWRRCRRLFLASVAFRAHLSLFAPASSIRRFAFLIVVILFCCRRRCHRIFRASAAFRACLSHFCSCVIDPVARVLDCCHFVLLSTTLPSPLSCFRRFILASVAFRARLSLFCSRIVDPVVCVLIVVILFCC